MATETGRAETRRPQAVTEEAVPSPVPSPRFSLRRFVREMAPPGFIVLVIAVVWERSQDILGQPDYILPSLGQVIRTTISRGDILIPDAVVTAQEVVLGFAVGSAVAIGIGLAIFHFATIRRAFYPLVVASHTVPVVAIAPLLIIWFGFGMASKVVIAALVCFFPITINTIVGMGQLENEAVQLLRSLGASPWQIFIKARLPAALPFIFAGLRIGATVSVIGALVGEWVGAIDGIGPLMLQANEAFDTSLLFAAIIYLSAMGIAMFTAVVVIERAVIPWYYLTRTARSP